MKKALFFAVLVLFSMTALMMAAQESKKILKIQKAYIYMEEELLVNETDLNCSYFIKEDMPRDIHIISKHVPNAERNEFSDHDELIIDKGSKAGLKEGDLLMILQEGKLIDHPRSRNRLGRYFLKKSLAEVTCIYDDRAVISLCKGCNPVTVGDFAIPFKPEQTIFQKKIDYKYCRIPVNAVNGMVVYSDLALGVPGVMAADTQYVSVDLGEGVVGKGSFLLIYRELAADLPPLIIGTGIVIHSEKTNATMKILDAGTDVRVGDRVIVLPGAETGAAEKSAGGEEIPIVEALKNEGEAGAGADNALNFDVLFPFDGRQPLEDHAADFTAIRDFVAGKSEYLVTLRGYTCSIGGDEYNLRLSSARVEAIKNILVGQYAIDAAHIESFFYGEKEPQFDNSSEAERRKNRLVKIEVNGR